MSTPTPTMTLSPPAPKRGKTARRAPKIGKVVAKTPFTAAEFGRQVSPDIQARFGRKRRAASAPAAGGKRSRSPRRARSASPKRSAPKRSAGKMVTRRYKKTRSGPVLTTTVKVFTYFLYDPNVRGTGGHPKKIAVVKSRGHQKAALKAATRGLSQVMVRKADSPLVKVFATSRQTLNPPKVINRGGKTITFRTKPRAKLTGYFVTPLYVKRASPVYAAMSDHALNQQKRVQSPLSAAAKAAQQRRLLAGRNKAAAARGGYYKSTRPGTPRRA